MRKIGTRIMQHAIVFWAVYTIAFLFIEGWHWRATNPIEKVLDNISGVAFITGVAVWFFGVKDEVDEILNRQK